MFRQVGLDRWAIAAAKAATFVVALVIVSLFYLFSGYRTRWELLDWLIILAIGTMIAGLLVWLLAWPIHPPAKGALSTDEVAYNQDAAANRQQGKRWARKGLILTLALLLIAFVADFDWRFRDALSGPNPDAPEPVFSADQRSKCPVTIAAAMIGAGHPEATPNGYLLGRPADPWEQQHPFYWLQVRQCSDPVLGIVYYRLLRGKPLPTSPSKSVQELLDEPTGNKPWRELLHGVDPSKPELPPGLYALQDKAYRVVVEGDGQLRWVLGAKITTPRDPLGGVLLCQYQREITGVVLQMGGVKVWVNAGFAPFQEGRFQNVRTC